MKKLWTDALPATILEFLKMFAISGFISIVRFLFSCIISSLLASTSLTSILNLSYSKVFPKYRYLSNCLHRLSSFYKTCDPYSCSGDSPRLSSSQRWIWLNLLLEVLSHKGLCIHKHLLLSEPKQMIFEQQRKQISPSCLQSKYPKWMSYLYIRLEEDKGHPQQWACDRALWSF